MTATPSAIGYGQRSNKGSEQSDHQQNQITRTSYQEGDSKRYALSAVNGNGNYSVK